MDKKDEQDFLNDVRDYAETQFDKQIIYLSSGALGLTMIFSKNIIELTTSQFLWPMELAWVCFALAIAFNLASHRTSLKCSDSGILKKQFEDALDNVNIEKYDKKYKRFRNRTYFFNGASYYSFLAGSAFFITFMFLNLNLKDMSKKQSLPPKPERGDFGRTPPPDSNKSKTPVKPNIKMPDNRPLTGKTPPPKK